MLTIVAVFGVLLAAVSLWGLYRPKTVVSWVQSVGLHRYGMVFAVGVRLVLGFALILAAPATPFPQIIFALGVLALLAAVGIVIMGRERITKLVNWFSSASTTLLRTAFAFGAAFGGFLLYASL